MSWLRTRLVRARRALRRMRGPYAGRKIHRWETPVADVERLLMVSLVAEDRTLAAVFEASWQPGRPRWRVRFEGVLAYRVADELHLGELWSHLDRSGQRCGESFTVERSPWIAELVVTAREPRHYVVTTLDDVLEVAATSEPSWETAEPAPPDAPLAGRSRHFFWPEDRDAIEELGRDLQERRLRPGDEPEADPARKPPS